MSPPKVTAVRDFLERFHDQELEKLRPERQVQKSFIFPSSAPVAALQEVQSGLVRRIAKLYDKAGPSAADRHRGSGCDDYRESQGSGLLPLRGGPGLSADGGGVGGSRSGAGR